MKRGLVIWIVLIIWSCAVLHAQSDFSFILNKEGKVVVIPKKMDYEFHIPPYTYKSYTPSSTREIDMKLKEFVPEFRPLHIDERPMDMEIASTAYRPFFDVFTPMIRQMSPMALDFEELEIVPLNEQFSFLSYGQQQTWPGLGRLITVDGNLIWQQNQWMLGGGLFAGRYSTPYNASPVFMGGFNLNARYEATEWLALRAWGSYVMYEKDEKYNPHMLWNPYYNHTQVGGAFEFKFNENVGVGMGVNFEYNPVRRKMVPQYLIYPIFNTKTIRIGR